MTKKILVTGSSGHLGEALVRTLRNANNVVVSLDVKPSPSIGFGTFIISATSPFLTDDLAELRNNAPRVLRRRVPEYEQIYERLGWKMFEAIDRVYVNEAARNDLKWEPKYDNTRNHATTENCRIFVQTIQD